MQLNIFELTKPKYKITKPIRLIELFAGIGSQAKALSNIGANFEHYKVVEFDKYAIASYNSIHGTSIETSDITKISANDLEIIETEKYEYIMTYSFPCQDLSLAGKGAGMKKGTNTRSGLLWEVERLLNECCGFKEHRIKPKNTTIHSIADWVDDYNLKIDKSKLPQILLMENVPQVISKKNFADFRKWQIKLEELGYSNYYKNLNAKDYGIPQNRNRTFMVSVLGDYYYEFPRKKKLKLRLKDMLEEEVEEKYYLSDKMISFFQQNSKVNEEKGNGFRFDPKKVEEIDVAKTITTRNGSRMDDNFIQTAGKIEKWNQRGIVYNQKGIAPTICATDYKTPKLIQVGELDIKGNDCIKRVYSIKGLSPTLTNMQGGNRQPKVLIPLKKDTENYIEWEEKGKLDLDCRAWKIDKVSPTITTSDKTKILIPEATKKGYAEATDGDGVYINRPHQKRGVVQKGMIQTIKTSGNDVGVVVKGNYSPSGHSASRVVDTGGIAPTVMENHGTVTAIVEDSGYSEKSMEKIMDNIKDVEGVSSTITANPQRATIDSGNLVFTENQLRIRKLTPKECWRLMGFTDEDFDKASKVNSNAQLYKQAGNSIVVPVLEAIFKELL